LDQSAGGVVALFYLLAIGDNTATPGLVPGVIATLLGAALIVLGIGSKVLNSAATSWQLAAAD